MKYDIVRIKVKVYRNQPITIFTCAYCAVTDQFVTYGLNDEKFRMMAAKKVKTLPAANETEQNQMVKQLESMGYTVIIKNRSKDHENVSIQ